jgi:hypothetical protein
MATERSTSDDTTEKTFAEKAFPDPREMLGLMVSVQRLGQQFVWQMGEVMTDVMSMPLKRDRSDSTKKSNPMARAVSDMKDAVDGATEILQQGGKPR